MPKPTAIFVLVLLLAAVAMLQIPAGQASAQPASAGGHPVGHDPAAADAWLSLVVPLVVDADYPMAARMIRRAHAADPDAFSFSRSSALRRDLRALPSGTRTGLAAAALSGVQDGYFLLGVVLTLTGDVEQGSAVLRLHDVRVGGDPVAAAIAKFAPQHTVAPSVRKLREGRQIPALSLALSDFAGNPSPASLGLAIALLLSSGELPGAERLLEHAAAMPPEWPDLTDAKVWDASGVTSGLIRVSGQQDAGVIAPRPGIVLGLTLLGHSETAAAMAAELAAGSLTQSDRQILQIASSIGALPPASLPLGSATLLREAGVIPSFPRIFDTIYRGKPAEAALLMLRMNAEERLNPAFQLARGLALVCQGRNADALPSLVAWLASFQEGDPVSPRIEGILPREVAVTLQGPPPRYEDPARLLLRFVIALQAQRDVTVHIEEMVLAGEAHAATAELMRRLAGPATVAETEPAAIIAQRSLRLGDQAFASGEYQRAYDLYLAAGQADERAEGLPLALLRGAFACGRWDVAALKFEGILMSLRIANARAQHPEFSVAGFATGVAAAYGAKAEFTGHLAALARHAADKPLLAREWLLWGVLERESGTPENANRAFDGVETIADPALASWAKAFRGIK